MKIFNKWVLVKYDLIKYYKKEIIRLNENLESKNSYNSDVLALERKEKKLKNDKEILLNELKIKESDIQNLSLKIKSLAGCKGGFIKKINSLSKELEETKKQLAESMTDKYVVKKLPETKTIPQKMKLVRPIPSNVNSYMKKEIEEVRNAK